MYQFYVKQSKRSRLPNGKLLTLFVMMCLLSAHTIAQYTVTDHTDGPGIHQLRGAITAADAAGGTSTISVSAGTYTLTLGEVTFGNKAQNITIIGAGAANTIISMTTGTGKDRIFLIDPPGTIPNIQTTILGITFKNGSLTSDALGGGAIICGGPSNAMTLTSCVFDSNTTGTGGGSGGALQMNGGGTLSIDQCTFINNTCRTGDGGALYYFLPNNINGTNISGSLTITNSTFNNNRVTTANVGSGGAVSIGIQGTLGGTSSVSIQKNTFTNNHVTTASGDGGAIVIDNGFSSSNTDSISYNRFVGNTAANSSTNAVGMSYASGNVEAINNWWGCNLGPTGCNDKAAIVGTGSGGGTLTLTPYLQLTSSASPATICSNSPGNTSTITASFLKNSAGNNNAAGNLTALAGVPISFSAASGTISNAQTTIQPGGMATATFTSNGAAATATVNPVVDNVPDNDAAATTSITVKASPTITTQPAPVSSVCNGNTVTLTVAATGSSSYQWYKDSTALTNGPTGTGSAISGANMATLTITNTGASDSATYYHVIITGSSGCQTTSGNASLTVAPLAIAASTTTGTGTISSTNAVLNDASCKRIAVVTTSGASPVRDNVMAKVTIDSTQLSYKGQPYVIRHYDITPETEPNTATATLTLYFLQSEFDSYNAVMPGAANDLPAGPSDSAGKVNLRITQFHGTGTAPGNYTGWSGAGPATVLINPGADNVVWNSTSHWWEVTFNVTGFSGFYVTGLNNVTLPITLQSFTAAQQGNSVLLKWVVSEEINVSHYEIEYSTDGSNFITVGNITATHIRNYSFLHNAPAAGMNYYRLKTADIEGRTSYSNVMVVIIKNNDFTIRLAPNPFHQQLTIYVQAEEQANTTFILTELNGRIVLQQSKMVTQGANAVTLKSPANLAKGTYLLRIVSDKMDKTLKVIKAE